MKYNNHFDAEFSDHALISISIALCTGHVTYNKSITNNNQQRTVNNKSTDIKLDYNKMNHEQWDNFQKQLIKSHNDWLAHQSPSLNNHTNPQNHVDHLYTIIEGLILKSCKGLPTKKTQTILTDLTTTTEIRYLNNVLYHIYKTIGPIKRWSTSNTTDNATFKGGVYDDHFIYDLSG